jgi:hypothetical protein
MYELIGGIQLFEPRYFVFTDPVQLFIPAASAESPADLTVLHYDAAQDEWIPVPLNTIDEGKKRLGVNVFELGYFAVARMNGGSKKVHSSDRVGGIRYNHSHTSDYYYTLTIAAVEYDNPAIGWPNLVGYSSSTGNRVTGGPLSSTHMGNIPKGTYTVYISRVKRGTHFTLPGERETWTVPSVLRVGSFTGLTRWKMEDWQGWTDLSLSSGGQWRKGAPSTWPPATVPYPPGSEPLNGRWSVYVKWKTPPYNVEHDIVDFAVVSSTKLRISEVGENPFSFTPNMERSADKRTVKLWEEEGGEFWRMDFRLVDVGMNRFEGTIHSSHKDTDENNNPIVVEEHADIVGTRVTTLTASPPSATGESLQRLFRPGKLQPPTPVTSSLR